MSNDAKLAERLEGANNMNPMQDALWDPNDMLWLSIAAAFWGIGMWWVWHRTRR